ncbi:hypothetical protein BGP_4539 [Beggiatoa sp. PS]|nr:hypothetical protein BGP_4539 [Beggiatoa sp. PS]
MLLLSESGLTRCATINVLFYNENTANPDSDKKIEKSPLAWYTPRGFFYVYDIIKILIIANVARWSYVILFLIFYE